jgi:hypothetical protein
MALWAISPLNQAWLGCAADCCTLVGSIMLALETVFKESRHKSVENLRHGIRLLLQTRPTTVGGESISGPESADAIERRNSSRVAKVGVCILLIGFFLQVVNRALDITKASSGRSDASQLLKE